MGTLELTIRSPLGRDDLPGLCERVRALLDAHRPATVRADVSGLPAEAVSLEALARLCLATRRHGACLVLHGSSPDLARFVAFAGLRDVLS